MSQSRLFAEPGPKKVRVLEDESCSVCGTPTGFGIWGRRLCRAHLPPDFFPAARKRP